MSKQHDGGPAFPHLNRFVTANTYEPISEGGMTLRDYFAAKAMQGYVSDEEWRYDIDFDGTARVAYAMADAMLAARNAKEGA